jgi:membrane-bound ClpP family serine protease
VTRMPWFIAVLAHPAGRYALLVLGLGCLVRAYYVPGSFVAGFAGVSAWLLATLGYLAAPPGTLPLLGVLAGGVLMIVEFTIPAGGFAALLAVAATAWGSWGLLAAKAGGSRLEPAPRAALVVVCVFALFAAVGHALRRHTLPKRSED